MITARKVYLTVGVVAAALLVALWLEPRMRRALAPRPTAAYVGIEAAPGEPVEVGRVEIQAGQPFRLFAVVEAEGDGGEPVYYTEAAALRIGRRVVPPERLRPWNPSWPVRLLWFTVEPWAHYVELRPSQGLDPVVFQDFFHADWPMQWVIDGRLGARSDDQAANAVDEPRPFGTQRFQVGVELYERKGALVPSSRLRSWGMADLDARIDEFPTVSALLPGPAAAASAVFGLTGVALPPDASEELQAEAARRAEKRLLFTEPWLLRRILADAGRDLEALEWRSIELAPGPRWGEEVAVGDLLRVGARWALTYRDADGDEVLGPDDLCLDFEKGAAIRPVRDVFGGKGEIEWARLAT